MKVKSSNQEEITKKLLETNKEWIEFYTEKLERYQTEREILLNHLKQTQNPLELIPGFMGTEKG